MEIAQIGRALLVAGVLIVVVGLALTFADRVPLLGRLPGDLRFGGDRFVLYVPLATSLLLSLVLTAVLALVGWLRR